ncbi:unnamed protein product [Pedinophyceae sp. YPF-701]|nr:unnamed protein product [Pedinophyceae sp. YPF-701]
MRQVVITVPLAQADLVVSTLQEECGIRSLSRIAGEESASITLYASHDLASMVMHELDRVGCGVAYGRIALLPVNMLKPLPKRKNLRTGVIKDKEAKEEKTHKEARKVKARMAIEEIYNGVAENGGLSWDYCFFVLVASLIAGLGLATNNTVMIVASMLVSPLMGPIVAFTFGTVVADTDLLFPGMLAELVGACISIGVGLFLGVIFAPWADRYDWPTNEMESRGEYAGLLVGLAFAIPSGAGVALSVTGGGANALVGVAIAASLLPPVVNFGMCLSFAGFGPAVIGDEYDSGHFLRMGGISMALFALNVGCIIGVAALIFWLKDIRPVRKQLSFYKELPAPRIKDATRDSDSRGPGSVSGLTLTTQRVDAQPTGSTVAAAGNGAAPVLAAPSASKPPHRSSLKGSGNNRRRSAASTRRDSNGEKPDANRLTRPTPGKPTAADAAAAAAPAPASVLGGSQINAEQKSTGSAVAAAQRHALDAAERAQVAAREAQAAANVLQQALAAQPGGAPPAAGAPAAADGNNSLLSGFEINAAEDELGDMEGVQEDAGIDLSVQAKSAWRRLAAFVRDAAAEARARARSEAQQGGGIHGEAFDFHMEEVLEERFQWNAGADARVYEWLGEACAVEDAQKGEVAAGAVPATGEVARRAEAAAMTDAEAAAINAAAAVAPAADAQKEPVVSGVAKEGESEAEKKKADKRKKAEEKKKEEKK